MGAREDDMCVRTRNVIQAVDREAPWKDDVCAHAQCNPSCGLVGIGGFGHWGGPWPVGRLADWPEEGSADVRECQRVQGLVGRLAYWPVGPLARWPVAAGGPCQ